MVVASAVRSEWGPAFETVLATLLEPGYRLACAMLHDPQAAEDAVQEAAFKAWRKIGRLKAGHELRPWFLGIVANECRSARRARWRSVLTMPAAEGRSPAPAEALLAGFDERRNEHHSHEAECGAGSKIEDEPAPATTVAGAQRALDRRTQPGRRGRHLVQRVAQPRQLLIAQHGPSSR